MNIRRPSIRRTPSKNISRKIQDEIDSLAKLAAERHQIPIEDARQELLAQSEGPLMARYRSQRRVEARKKRTSRLSHTERAHLETLQALNNRIKAGQFHVEIWPGQLWDIPLLSDRQASIVRLTLSGKGDQYLFAKEVAGRLGMSRQTVNRKMRFILDHYPKLVKGFLDSERIQRERKPLKTKRLTFWKGCSVRFTDLRYYIRKLRKAHVRRPEQTLWHLRAAEECLGRGRDSSALWKERFERWVKFGLPHCYNPRCRAMLMPGDLDFNGVTITRSRKYCSPACRKDRRVRGELGADNERTPKPKGSVMPAHASPESPRGAETDDLSQVEQFFQEVSDRIYGKGHKKPPKKADS